MEENELECYGYSRSSENIISFLEWISSDIYLNKSKYVHVRNRILVHIQQHYKAPGPLEQGL